MTETLAYPNVRNASSHFNQVIVYFSTQTGPEQQCCHGFTLATAIDEPSRARNAIDSYTPGPSFLM